MHLKQHYLACLSHASYLIADETSGQAVVVDPQRDVAVYLEEAAALGVSIVGVIETHFHADFLSGHLELAAATGATIGYGEAAAGRAEYPIVTYADGERIRLGEVELEILATPGHTPESICVVVRERPGAEPVAVLTGDTLFIGDVGRPDLLASVGVTADELGRQLYRSLHERLLSLPDATLVYPAHGAGSACGKQLSVETVSTIGEQRRTNYALAAMSESEFVAAVTEGQAAAPLYFSFAANKNRQQRALLDHEHPVARLGLDEVLEAVAAGAVVLDARDEATFAAGHLAGSLNVGLGGRFAEYAGTVMRAGTRIVLVTPPGDEQEAITRLARIGFDDVIGVLAGPERALSAHPELTATSSRLTAAALVERIATVPGLTLVDVRNPGEVALGTIQGAEAISLAALLDRLDELDRERPVVVFCAGGYRSSIAASLLSANGFADVSDLLGGYGAWATVASAHGAPASAG